MRAYRSWTIERNGIPIATYFKVGHAKAAMQRDLDDKLVKTVTCFEVHKDVKAMDGWIHACALNSWTANITAAPSAKRTTVKDFGKCKKWMKRD